MRLRYFTFICLVLGFLVAKGQTELITNGNFETGDLTGWVMSTQSGASGWYINDGTYVPLSGQPATAPINGTYDVVSDQWGSGLNLLSQPILLPDHVCNAVLTWKDRIYNWNGIYEDPAQEFRVSILHGTDAPIVVFSTNPGDAPQQQGPNIRTIDLTSVLQSLAGESIQVEFVEQDTYWFFNVYLDDISLQLFDLEPPVIHCPADVTLNNDPGFCSASYAPPMNGLVSGIAVPGIDLPNAVQNQAGVAYNPDLKLYYTVRAGSPSYTLYTCDQYGTVVASHTANFDFRALWWNPNTGDLEGNSFNGQGYRKVDLDASGYALSSGSTNPVSNYQPDAQSQADYDWDADEVIFYNAGSIYRTSRSTGTLLGSYAITGLPVPSVNTTFVGYTGLAGYEVLVYDYVNKRVYFVDKATGIYSGTVQLPASAPGNNYLNTSYANGYIWISDSPGYDQPGVWKSYKIIDVIATDNCGLKSLTYAPAGPYPVGETMVTWTAEDYSGNSASCVQKITVNDVEPPVMICPPDLELANDPGQCSRAIAMCPSQVGFAGNFSPANWSLVNTNGGNGYVKTSTAPEYITLVGSDNETGNSSFTHYSTTMPCNGTVKFSWNYQSYDEDGPYFDPFGYSLNGTFHQLTDSDGSAAQSGTLELPVNDGDIFAFSIFSVDNWAGYSVNISSEFSFTSMLTLPVASDNCGIESYTQSNPGPYPVGETLVTWTVKDFAGNSASCIQKITVLDAEPPVIVCQPDLEVPNDPGQCSKLIAWCNSQVGFAGDFAPAYWALINTNGGNGYVKTEAAPASITLVGSDNGGMGSNYTHYQITMPCYGKVKFTWNYYTYDWGPVFDPFGYSVNGTFHQLTDDYGSSTQNGMLEVPVNTGDVFAFTIYTTDNALGFSVNISSEFIFTSLLLPPDATDNCGVIAIWPDKTGVFPVGETMVTWTAQDKAGNLSECAQKVTVKDTELPTIICPAPIELTSDAGECYATFTEADLGTPVTGDNCGVLAVSSDFLIVCPGGQVPAGQNTITWTVADVNGNTNTCAQMVSVNKIATITTVNVYPDVQQYSDLVTFKASLQPGSCNDFGQAATHVVFYVNWQPMGPPVELQVSGNMLVAKAAYPMLEIPGFPPNGVMAPGPKIVKAIFIGIDDNYIVKNPLTKLTIVPEKALLSYDGVLIQATESVNISTATVKLTAVIKDIVDGYPGDIRNACVRFVVIDDANNQVVLNQNWPVNQLIVPWDITAGTVSTYLNVNLGTAPFKTFTVKLFADCYYLAAHSVSLTVYKPDGDFITGGGYIVTNDSYGTRPSEPGTNTNFGFHVKFNKKNTNLIGGMNIIYRRMVGDELNEFQIKTNAMSTLGVDVTNPANKTAVFTSKTNLTNLTTGYEIEGNLALYVTLTDRGEPGVNDAIGFTVWRLNNKGKPSILVYSSSWNGVKTIERYLEGGNLVVHSGFSRSEEVAEPESPALVTKVDVYPNPFIDKVNFVVQSDTDSHAVLEIYDFLGAKLATVFEGEVTAQTPYKWEYKPVFKPNGALIYRLVMGNYVKTGKLVNMKGEQR